MENVVDSESAPSYICSANKLRETLKTEMQKRGWNAYDIGRASGVPQATVYRFLTGKHEDLRTRNVEKIARAMNLTEGQLRGIEPILGNTDQFVEDLSKIKEKTISETEQYWFDVLMMCKQLIAAGFYPDTEDGRRALFWEAFNAMTHYNYPEISLIEQLLRSKSHKSKNENMSHS